MMMNKELIIKLHSLGAIKFGSFELKKDFIAPFNVDFARVISNGAVAKEICGLLWQKGKNLSFDLLCGVPLMGSSFATYIAWENNFPLVLERTGLRHGDLSIKIEGSFKSGQRGLLLQAASFFGEHSLNTIEDLEAEGIVVKDVLTFLDLKLGAKKKLKSRGYVFHSIIGLDEVVQILSDAGKLSGEHYKLASEFLENNVDSK